VDNRVRRAITIGILVACGYATQAQQLAKVAQQDADRSQACRDIDHEIFPPETCSVILTYLSPQDKVGTLYEDGSFIVLSPLPDGKTDLKTYYFPPRLRSAIALNSLSRTLREVALSAADEPKGIFAAMLPQGRELWSNLRDVYCYYHPSGRYKDLDGADQQCIAVRHVADEKTVEGYFGGAMIFNLNYVTFLQAKEATARANNPQ